MPIGFAILVKLNFTGVVPSGAKKVVEVGLGEAEKSVRKRFGIITVKGVGLLKTLRTN